MTALQWAKLIADLGVYPIVVALGLYVLRKDKEIRRLTEARAREAERCHDDVLKVATAGIASGEKLRATVDRVLREATNDHE